MPDKPGNGHATLAVVDAAAPLRMMQPARKPFDSDLTDAEWALVRRLLPRHPPRVHDSVPPDEDSSTHACRLSKDYEKLVENSDAMVQIVMIRLMLQRLCRPAPPQKR
jgi:hypothetical protein